MSDATLFLSVLCAWMGLALSVLLAAEFGRRRQRRRRRPCPPSAHGPAVMRPRRAVVLCLTCGGQYVGDHLDCDLWALSHDCKPRVTP